MEHCAALTWKPPSGLRQMIEAIVFACITAALVFVSRRSLLRPLSHGFYRFFAWEAAAGLVLLNARWWFTDPLTVRQLCSWTLLALSVALVVLSVRALVHHGKPTSTDDDPTRVGIERTTVLIEVGVYRHIRHPLYCSLLLLVCGAVLKRLSWATLTLAVAATALTVATAKVEEVENRRLFGPDYARYVTRTRMFIPLVF